MSAGTRLRFGLMWLAALLADAAEALAYGAEGWYQAAARCWWHNHPNRDTAPGCVALPKWIER